MAPPTYDKIVVVDIECTCWERGTPEGQTQDIIEVGVCLLDLTTGEIEKPDYKFVRPLRSAVSPFCTQLTTITPEMVEKAPIFGDICRWLKDEYNTTERSWASYGEFDRRLFASQCAAMNVRNPFSPEHINVKPLYSILNRMTRAIGCGRALRELGIPFAGTQHRAKDDAIAVAQVLRSCLPCGNLFVGNQRVAERLEIS